jgi:hypothetical protein
VFLYSQQPHHETFDGCLGSMHGRLAHGNRRAPVGIVECSWLLLYNHRHDQAMLFQSVMTVQALVGPSARPDLGTCQINATSLLHVHYLHRSIMCATVFGKSRNRYTFAEVKSSSSSLVALAFLHVVGMTPIIRWMKFITTKSLQHAREERVSIIIIAIFLVGYFL